MREGGGGRNCGINRLGCFAGRIDVSLVSCACEGECVAVLRLLISDLLPYILL